MTITAVYIEYIKQINMALFGKARKQN